MRFDPQAGVTRGADGPNGSRRRHGRLPQELLHCNLGEVLNISAGGMRIACRTAPPARVHVVIEGQSLPGPLLAELAWCKREGLFRRIAGYKFIDVSPQLAERLSSIASVNRLRRAM